VGHERLGDRPVENRRQVTARGWAVLEQCWHGESSLALEVTGVERPRLRSPAPRAFEELNVAGDDHDLVAFLPVVGLPAVLAKPSADPDALALDEVLAAGLRETTERLDVEERGAVGPLAVFLDPFVDRDREVAVGGLVRRVLDRRV